MTRPTVVMLALIASIRAWSGPGEAFDGDRTFARGSWLASFEGGGGTQANVEHLQHESDIKFWYLGARLGFLPFDPLGRGPFHGAVEIGLEPLYQRYTAPRNAFYAGLAAVGRYHFLALGRVVPYLELAAAAGGTNLRVPEIQSDFAFWVAGGGGASFFVTDTIAIYAGYRVVHVSNGNTSRPNRGFEADTGLAGVSFFLK